MRYALLVAWREFSENAKTKGFWLGLFLFPVIIAASFAIQNWLAKATPTRHFTLVDRTGQFTAAVDARLAERHREAVVEAFGAYVSRHVADVGSRVRILEGFGRTLGEQGLAAGVEAARPALPAGAPPFVEPRRSFRRVGLPTGVDPESADLAELAKMLRPYLRGERKLEVDGAEQELFAAVLIPADLQSSHPGDPPLAAQGAVQYWSANLADDKLRDQITDVLDEQVRGREYLARGLDAETVRAIERTHLTVSSLNPKKEEGREQVGMADVIRQWAPVGFVYLLWIAIFSISQMLLNNTIEEKSNRVIEVLLSSVTPGELMMGKLIGIAAVGLTMLLTWIGCLLLVLGFQANREAELATEMLGVLRSSGLLPAFGVYFLLGYLLYSGIFLTIGSLCNTLKEAQNFMGPVMVIMMVPLFTMMFIPRDPNGTLATVMSWIPPYTPFVMMNRAAADPPLFDIVGTMLLLLVTTVAVLWLSGRIFRVGILRTGQPPRIRELVRWVRSSA